MAAAASTAGRFAPLVCIVDFHHARGPEVEQWFGVRDEEDPVVQHDWSLLPFLALPDGSHASDEEFSYFTLRLADASKRPVSSLFGIACTRHIDAAKLLRKSPDVTRSSVQKALVAVVDSPYMFARIREKLSAATKTWFAQRDFSDTGIVAQFHESLVEQHGESKRERDQYVGISLRELVHQYKHQTLVLFKCALLQRKMLFFGSNCERLCLLQFALISLIPGLINSLQDCADPRLNTYEKTLVMPTSLKTSERASLLKYMGVPLQLFGEGSLFGPYTPLQQLDVLSDTGTRSFIAGSTNSLVLSQKERYSDVFINLNDDTITIHSPNLRNALHLTPADRRWIDFLTQNVNDTWDPDNPTRPTTHGYAGSEEFIRLQFEEYLLALLASVKYRQHAQRHGQGAENAAPSAPGSTPNPSEPASDFGQPFIEAWLDTDNARIFGRATEPHLFDIVEPRHPCAGGLTVEDIQRRLAQQVADLHLDTRLTNARDSVNRTFASGGARVSSALTGLWADIEAMREAQRLRRVAGTNATPGAATTAEVSETAAPDTIGAGDAPPTVTTVPGEAPSTTATATPAEQTSSAAKRASAYLSGWSAWASEKRRAAGWPRPAAATPSPGTGAAVVGEEKAEGEKVFDAEEGSRPNTASASGTGERM